jgi:hypothetical protein
VTFLAREFFRTSFNTRTNPGELEALMLMQKAPKDRQMGHALRIKSMFQARLLIDSGAITEDGANAHIHTVANLVDKGPYGKDRY